jgi:murein DD-endopeptidase MepM/ murein hydrolase activator NlpD
MGKQGTRTRSHAHSKRHGRLTLHFAVVALALLAVTFASQYPTSTRATTRATVPTLSYSGVSGTASLMTDGQALHPGTSLRTLGSVVALTRVADVKSVRAVGGLSPTASFSSGVAAAAASSGVDGAGVTALADIIDPRKPFIIYKAKGGDTLSDIAGDYGIKVETILDNNPTLTDKNLLVLGQELVIPLDDGIMHKVSGGETLREIVAQYDNITLEDALAYRANGIVDAANLEAGSYVLLVGATRKPPPPPVITTNPNGGETAPPFTGLGPPASGGLFSSPLLEYLGISDAFGTERGAGRIHEGIDLDLANFHRSPIFAACAGTVSRAEYLTYSYGYHVIVDCGDGWTTLYAHMSQIDVVLGQAVGQREALGYSGVTGFTTGEHLHFEIRSYGTPVNPAQYIDFHGY